MFLVANQKRIAREFDRHAARRRLNDHFGLVMRHDGVSTAILVSSCGTTASQRPFRSHHATRRRLNGHFGLVMRHDGSLSTQRRRHATCQRHF